MDSINLEGDSYLNEIDEDVSMSAFVNVSMSSDESVIQTRISGITGCSNLLEAYYAA